MQSPWRWGSGIVLMVGLLTAGVSLGGQVGTPLFIEEDGTLRYPLSDTGTNVLQVCNGAKTYCHQWSITGESGLVYAGICNGGSCATDITTATSQDMNWWYGPTVTHTMLQETNDFRPTSSGWISPRSGTANVSTMTADCNTAAEAGRVYIDTDETDSGMLYLCDGIGWRQQGNRTVSKSISLLAPTATETGKVQWTWPLGITLTSVTCSTDVGTATINLEERAVATPNTTGTESLTADLACDTTSETTTSFADASIAANVPHALQIASVATAPTVVRVHITGTLP